MLFKRFTPTLKPALKIESFAGIDGIEDHLSVVICFPVVGMKDVMKKLLTSSCDGCSVTGNGFADWC